MRENLENAIEYVNEHIRFGSTINNNIVEKISKDFYLNNDEKHELYDELDSLQVVFENVSSFKKIMKQLIELVDDNNVVKKSNLLKWYEENIIQLDNEQFEKVLSSLGCSILDDTESSVSENLEIAIDYINEHIRFGSTIKERDLQVILNGCSLDKNDELKVYEELELLQVTVERESLIKVDLQKETEISYKNISSNINISKLNDDETTEIHTEVMEAVLTLHEDNVFEEDEKQPYNTEEFAFLDDEEDNDLDDILDSISFLDGMDKLKIGIDKSHNIQYLKDVQTDDATKKYDGLDNIIAANKRLVWKVARRYQKLSTSSFDVDDMVQSGIIGLIKAAEKFDINSGNQFSTYATIWIKQSITRDIADYSNTIRIPVHLRDRILKMINIENNYFNNTGNEANNSILAAMMEVEITEIEHLKFYLYQSNLDSLSRPVGDDDSSYLGEFLESETKLTDEIVEDIHLKEMINTVLETLNSRERSIIKLRFGLINNRRYTLEEIGEEFGVTRERIRQIEVKALSKLRHPTRSRRLKSFIIS